MRHVALGSQWSRGLLALVESAKWYTSKCGVAPAVAAVALADLLHAVEPPQCTAINYTMQMRLAAWTPQRLLDLVAVREMKVG